jgi:hypothetical protein
MAHVQLHISGENDDEFAEFAPNREVGDDPENCTCGSDEDTNAVSDVQGS